MLVELRDHRLFRLGDKRVSSRCVVSTVKVETHRRLTPCTRNFCEVYSRCAIKSSFRAKLESTVCVTWIQTCLLSTCFYSIRRKSFFELSRRCNNTKRREYALERLPGVGGAEYMEGRAQAVPTCTRVDLRVAQTVIVFRVIDTVQPEFLLNSKRQAVPFNTFCILYLQHVLNLSFH